jgi:predicted ATPase
VFLWRGDWENAAEHIELFTAHARKHSLEPLRATGICMRGELLVLQGEATHGIAMLRGGLAALHLARHEILTAGFMTALAEGLAADGECGEALAQIDECIVWGEASGQLGNAPNALRVTGDILVRLPSPKPEDAERCYSRALDAARRQGAHSWELRAANNLSDLWLQQGRTTEAREMLSPIYAQITEGQNTCDLVRARASFGL